MDGGMTGNSFLLQLIADLLGVKAVNISLEEVSALGAAYMAGCLPHVVRVAAILER